jgi:hypothetical protein
MLAGAEAVWAENFNFRHTRWGMTQDEVISSEEKLVPVEKTQRLIRYKMQILNKNVELLYVFSLNKLIGSLYKLDDNYLNSQHFITTYNKFKQALVRKYGRPDEDTTDWLNKTYKVNRKKWGLALSLGHTKYASIWNTNHTTIESNLRENNHNVLCIVEYRSKEHSHLFAEISKVHKIDPF